MIIKDERKHGCLVDEHENDSHVAEGRARKEREGIGVIKKHVSKGPIHC